MTAAPPVVAPATGRRGFRLGLWAMILGIVSPLWGTFAIFLWARGQSQLVYPDQAPLWPASISGLVVAFEVLGAIVLPLGVIATIVLAFVALARNRRGGQVMGGIGLLALVLSVVGVIAFFAWIFDGIARVS